MKLACYVFNFGLLHKLFIVIIMETKRIYFKHPTLMNTNLRRGGGGPAESVVHGPLTSLLHHYKGRHVDVYFKTILDKGKALQIS